MWYNELTVVPRKRDYSFGDIFEAMSIALQEKTTYYQSVFLYPEKDIAEIQAKQTVAGYNGLRYADTIVIDIDKEKNSNEFTLERVRKIILFLEGKGLTEENFIIWFSGTGYHIDISSDCFQIPPSKEYVAIVKRTMVYIFKELEYETSQGGKGLILDTAIYTNSGLIRTPFARNQKSGLFKIPLTREEIFEYTPENIFYYASESMYSKRKDYGIDRLCSIIGNGELKKYVTESEHQLSSLDVTAAKTVHTTQYLKDTSPEDYLCYYKMLTTAPIQGQRNKTLLLLASHLRKLCLPITVAKTICLKWNNNSLDPYQVEKQVEYCYKKGYTYACNNPELSQWCDRRCKRISQRDISFETVGAKEQLQQYQAEQAAIAAGDFIDLNKFFGVSQEYKLNLMKGEMLVVVGKTGVNKTTLISDIVLGSDMYGKNIYPDRMKTTLVIATEMSGASSFRTNLQIVSGARTLPTGDELISMTNKLLPYIDNIRYATCGMDIDAIEEMISKASQEVIVIDYLGEVSSPKAFGFQFITDAIKRLYDVGKRYNKYMIVVSQVSKAAEKNPSISLDDAYGSVAIGQKARKAIVINGDKMKRERIITFEKNDGGETPTFRTHVEPNRRFVKDEELAAPPIMAANTRRKQY